MVAVGIDLGTTNSAIAIMRGRPVIIEDFTGQRTMPSAIGWDPELEELVVGLDAKLNPEIYGSCLSIKRLMGTDERVMIGDREWLPEEVSAEILKALVRQVSERTGEEVTEAVITVPAHFNMSAMAATKRAGELAGLEVQQLLAEPSAAVMAYGPRGDEKIIVYDLGGGTFDVTVLDYFAGILTTKAVFGNNRLGGDDFDRRLVDHFVNVIREEQGIEIDLENDLLAHSILRKQAELTKIELSRKPIARVKLARITDVGDQPVSLETSVSLEQFNAMIQDLIELSLKEVKKALEHAKLESSEIDNVLMVGGSTYVPLVQQMVSEFFGKEPNRTINPDLSVALGAAASLIDNLSDERHIVTVGHLPEVTPEKGIDIEGRTSPSSKIRISHADGELVTEADEEGYYSINVELSEGLNNLEVTSISPQNESKTLIPEPVFYDPNAELIEVPSVPPPPRLTRGLCISCNLSAGVNRDASHASVILEPQTELPSSFSSSEFSTRFDGQQKLIGEIVEGDLAIPELNTKLGEIRLLLPPNVPAREQVIVHFSVDESYILTAELEVPSVNRRANVEINLKSSTSRQHIFDELDDLLVRSGDHLRPDVRKEMETSRDSVEQLNDQLRVLEEGEDPEELWDCYQQLESEAKQLRVQMASARSAAV